MATKHRMRQITDSLSQTMLDKIVMSLIDGIGIIGAIANRKLPELAFLCIIL